MINRRTTNGASDASGSINTNPELQHDLPDRARAFTLVELMTLIALVTLGVLCLLPAFAHSKTDTKSLRCLNNLRQLGAAWRMYADDNAERLVWNRDGANVGQSSSQNWVGGWLDFTSSTDNTNTALLVDHARYAFAAYLGPYIKSAAVFKCPADFSAINAGFQRLPRVRSVSMNNCVGEGNRSWINTSQYQLYRRIDSIAKPRPAALWIFLDEREESINDGCFFSNPDLLYNLIDYPAAYHNRGAGFAFADGHSEIHHWTDPRTTPILSSGQLLPFNIMVPGDPDVTWLQQHASSRP
jgi:prepilin-type processing-associated H-X9-DG protein